VDGQGERRMKRELQASWDAWRALARRIHRDERGAVSIETVLIIAAIAVPILIFILKFGWPRIKNFFDSGMNDLEGAADNAKGLP